MKGFKVYGDFNFMDDRSITQVAPTALSRTMVSSM